MAERPGAPPPGMDQLGQMQYIRSDEDSKREIENAARAIDQFLSSMQPQSYEYRNPTQPGALPGRVTGVMAQDVARSDIGQQIARTDPATGQQGYDQNGALQALMAASARLHDRLRAVEENQAPQYDVQFGEAIMDPPPPDRPAQLSPDQMRRRAFHQRRWEEGGN